jgi:predicted Zn-dependent protease
VLLFPLLSSTAAQRTEPVPVALPPGYHPDMSSDEAGLWMKVDRAEDALKSSPNLVRDPALNAYVKGVVCKLAPPYCDSIRIYIVETPYFNAYAMPNGAIVVFSGLLLRSENEAQLAFVLGHEITHYLHRHSLDQLHRAVSTSGFAAVFGVMTAGAGVGLVGLLANLAAVGGFMAHTRDQERDADAGGFDSAVAAGYDPREAPAVWRHVTDEYNANPHKDRDLFFADHPQPEERLATFDKKAAAAVTARTDWIVNQDDYRARIAPYLKSWVADELGKGEPEETIVLFQRLALSRPDQGLFHYALGESYRKRNAPGDADKAVAAFHDALTCADVPALAWRSLGLMAMKTGENAEAKQDFIQYRTLLPDAEDKAMIDFYLTEL